MASLPLSRDNELTWQERAAKKRQTCYEKIPEEWRLNKEHLGLLQLPCETSKNNIIELNILEKSGILSSREMEITENYDATTLTKMLATGKFTALEVTLAFSKRAAVAQQLTNCLTETLFPEAQVRARELDAMRERGELAGPLHGLPISVKDTFHIKGTSATIGMMAFLDEESTENSTLIDTLQDLGAILFCKTNIPQSMMTADSENNIFGRTLNPSNTSLTAGGSSGGEGALVALRGSPLGVGTDIAGSIRLPSVACGTYGFRPSSFRIPDGKKRICANPGLVTVAPVAGPLANDMDSLSLFMETVLSAGPNKYDSRILDVPWRSVRFPDNKKLRLGVLAEDPQYPLHPPVRAALEEAVRLLQLQGHDTVHLKPEECRTHDAGQVAWLLFSLDGTAKRLIEGAGEPFITSSRRSAELMPKLNWDFVSDCMTMEGLEKLAALNIKRMEIVEHWHALWNTHGLDAVIGPPAPHSAVQHDCFGIPAYTLSLNVLDYPACVIPFGKVAGKPSDFNDSIKTGSAKYYPEIIKGAPLSIQVFTSRMRDEECIGISKIVDRCLRQDKANVADY